jgi:hypothetical protein
VRIFGLACLGLVSLASVPVWTQENPSVPVAAVSGPAVSGLINESAEEDRMLTPPPVSGEAYPRLPASEGRSNYLRGGITFNTAYSDNVLGSTNALPVGDVSYSVWPTLTLDQTSSRLHWVLAYAPGFTLYQHTNSRNESDQNLALDVQYRLSPHVTFSLRDSLQKSSNIFNQPDQGLAGGVSGSSQPPNLSVFAPLADQLSNISGMGITYQFARNSMVGIGGSLANLHYPKPAEVPGLYDAASRGGSAFYSYRLSKERYVGITYQYQQLLSYPAATVNETQTHSFLLFYTFNLASALSVSVFGGPQYSSSGAQYFSATQSAPPRQSWSPAAGASFNWQAHHSAFAVSYSRIISGGGGLIGAVELDSGAVSVMQQVTRNFSVSMAGSYGNNNVLAVFAAGNGHSISGSASIQRQIAEHLNLQAGYTRLHQNYSFLAANPDTNREWVSMSYQFVRPLGR